MEDNEIIKMIKSHDSQNALKEMEKLFKQVLKEKLKEKKIVEDNNHNFMKTLEDSIKYLPEYYEILTYLRNIYFFAEKTDTEKLYELAYIYENLKQSLERRRK